jgi:nicotinamidase-related amidase
MTLALVLLDLQKGIMLSDRIAWEDPATPDRTLAAAQALLDGARAANITVIHVGVERPRRRGAFDSIRTANAIKSGKPPRDVLALAAGTPDVEFVLAPNDDEEIVHKIGVSAFQGTRLDPLLRNDGVADVFVAGAFTHMVVESTVRQGFDLGYRMSVIEDACCSPAAAPHDAALAVGIANFARVITVADALQQFKRGSSGA